MTPGESADRAASGPVVAVVPAKGTSRRLPGKNLAPLAGVALFVHAVRLAKAVAEIDRVVVSSDSAEILAAAAAEGADARRRPEALCRDEVTNFDVLADLVAGLGAEGAAPSLLVLLQATTPFRTPGPLGAMIRAMRDDAGADSLVTVRPAPRVLGRIDRDRWHPDHPTAKRMRARDERFALTGHAFVLRPARTLDAGTLLGRAVRPAPLPEDWLDIDVDTPGDLAIARGVAEDYFRRSDVRRSDAPVSPS